MISKLSLIQEKIENDQKHKWNDFYKAHKDNFFKNRNYLTQEFEELSRKNTVNSSLINLSWYTKTTVERKNSSV
jgi:hypothetical protein